MADQLDERLVKLERDHRNLKLVVVLLLSGALFWGVTGLLDEGVALAQSEGSPQAITVSRITVVDAEGVVRLRIGSDLPDGVIGGEVKPRGHPFAGVLLYDETGQERSGYGTMGGGNVGLTLDTRTFQSAFFIAGPNRGAALRLWDGANAVNLRVDENGPSIHALRAGQVAFHEPPVVDAENSQFCGALRDAADRVSTQELWEACRARTSEAACQSCLAQ